MLQFEPRHDRIIDAHCHYGSGDGFTGPWDTRASLHLYLRRARRARIAHTVLIPALSFNYDEGNREVCRLIRCAPKRFSGFAAVNPLGDRGRVMVKVAPLVLRHGLVGIKLHHYNARITREICLVARWLSVPILWDVGGDIHGAELAAGEFPDVDFIIPHLGSFGDDWRAQRGCIDVLKRYHNIYADTSGVRRFDLLEEAVSTAGAHKIIFGSDGPWLHPGVELEKIRQLRLPPRKLRLILSGNILRLTSAARRRSYTNQAQKLSRQ